MSEVKLAPSILAADFARLGEQVQQAETAGAQRIHIDVMDGHFVPNITMGPFVVKAIRGVTRLPLECHLMITSPDRYLKDFADAGANSILVHAEADPHLHRTLQRIKELGLHAGVAINPATSIDCLNEIVADADLLLVMTVNPGFCGQRFLASTLPKIQRVRDLVNRVNPDCEVVVDGGIDATTAKRAVQAGADVLVAGSAIFNQRESVAAAMDRIRASIV
jgi:ribulose-phosphate 3-epimerase